MIMKRPRINRIFRSRRGQIRGIDFTVSLLLFLILLSQVILVIINAQIVVRGKISLDRDDVDFIADRILNNVGSNNWGYSQELPYDFGLKDEIYPWTTSSIYLDPGKLSRLNSDGRLLFNKYGTPNYQFLDYRSVRYLIGEEDIDFKLKIYLPLEITVNQIDEDGNDLSLMIKHIGTPYPAVDTRTDIFWVYLENGTARHRSTHYTNSTGQLIVNDAVVQTDSDPYIVLILCRSMTDYGLAWYVSEHFEVLHGKTIADDGSFLSYLGCLENRTAAIVTDEFDSSSFAVSGNRNHTVSLIYPFSNNYANTIVTDVSNMTLINDLSIIPGQGLITAVSTAYYDNNYYFNIFTLPTIFNDDGFTEFPVYPVFQSEDNNGEYNIQSILSASYIASSRNTSLIVTVDIWEKPL